MASTTWIAEFLRLNSNATKWRNGQGRRTNIKKRLAVTENRFEIILSDPAPNMVLFTTVRHPLER